MKNGNGYALDDNGLLLKTSDAGKSWLPVHSSIDGVTPSHPVNETGLQTIRFSDEKNGWAMDKDNRLLGTTDGGIRWNTVSTDIIKDVWIENGFICTLTPSGKVYARIPSRPSLPTGSLPDSVPADIVKVRTVSYGEQSVTIGLTGKNTLDYPFDNEKMPGSLPTGFTPVDITVKGNAVYLLSAEGTIVKSTDGGVSWGTPSSATIPPGTASSFDIADDNDQLVIGGTDGRIYRTTEFGINISAGEIKQPERLQAVHADSRIAVAVGNNGTVFWHSGADASKWYLRKLPTNENLYAVTASSAEVLVAGSAGKVYANSGLNNRPFTLWKSALDGAAVNSLAQNGSTLLIAGQSGRIDKIQGILSSSDQTDADGINAVKILGNTAFAVGNGGTIFRLNPVNASSFWTKHDGNQVYADRITASAKAGGKLVAVTAAGSVLSSTDNGISWQPKSVVGVTDLRAVHFYDATNGIAVGAGVILTTIDGGGNWTKSAQSTPAPNAVYMTAANQAYIVGDNGMVYFYNNNTLSSQNIAGNTRLNAVTFSPDNRVGYIAGDDGRLFKTTDGTAWSELTAPNSSNWVAFTDRGTGSTAHLNALYATDRNTVYAAGDNGVLLKTTNGGASWKRKASGTTADLRDIAFKDSETAILGGSYATARGLTDRRERFSAHFFYDRLGRLVASQNSKQRSMNPPHYSYTRYDALGRVVETGELASTLTPDAALLNHDRFPNNWSMNRRQVVRSQYDKPIADEVDSLFASGQQNLRNRVASVIYQDTLIYSRGDFESPREWSHATHVSYDIHGNVKELIQDNPALKDVNHQYKKLVYEYDLISGNVNQVMYQPNMTDRFYHKYEYDADNRITHVYTSQNGLVWDNDAAYQYYKHGPLARVELGDLKVQGIDYAYTLQGWIKAVNANSLNPANDMGGDGTTDSNVAKDAFGYSLHYNSNDYKPIGGSEQFLSAVASGAMSADLFNGNISRMATAISENVAGGQNLNLGTQVRDFKYDELNRLVASNKISGKGADNAYATTYQYDANGNFKNLTRKDGNGLAMDDFTYHYAKDGNGNILNNRLLHVYDDATQSAETADLKDQGRNYAQNDPSTHNYTYDEIGNLIADKQEEIEEIKWNVQGKVQEIKRKIGSVKSDLKFGYDGFGNRISKTEIRKTPLADGTIEISTYYVRDMQGNTMAVYEKKKYEDKTIDFALAEQHIYGSSRLGIRKTNQLLVKKNEAMEVDLAYSSRILGEKHYELTNHLGNVLAVVTDKKLSDNEADVVSTTDYFPFGMAMPGRVNNGLDYRYGFNTQEKVSEISTDHYTALFWEYDSRLGRRWNNDPIMYPWQSPYATFNNNPIYFKDPSGTEGEEGNKEIQKHTVSKGETLTGIAKQYNTSVEALTKWNNIADVNKIYVGNELVVSDPSRPAKHSSFESYPEVQESTGWTSGQLGVQETTVTNGLELAHASLTNKDVANLGGDLLEAVKKDPDMVAFQERILSDVKNDSRYGKEAFYLTGLSVREFGGKRGSGNDWFSFGNNDPILKKETWQVAANQLTWALRHATVKYWAEVGKDGTIKIQYRLYDTLDLSGQKGRSGAYNTISEILGFGYHTVAGGNENLQTRGKWSETK